MALCVSIHAVLLTLSAPSAASAAALRGVGRPDIEPPDIRGQTLQTGSKAPPVTSTAWEDSPRKPKSERHKEIEIKVTLPMRVYQVAKEISAEDAISMSEVISRHLEWTFRKQGHKI